MLSTPTEPKVVIDIHSLVLTKVHNRNAKDQRRTRDYVVVLCYNKRKLMSLAP